MILDLMKMLQSAGTGMIDGSVLGPKQGYEQASTILFGLTLHAIAEALDGAADAYSEEHQVLRAIFRDAAAIVDDASLRTRLEEASAQSETSLRISALHASNQVLRALLIDLHAWLEVCSEAGARPLEERIWQELARSTERRRMALGSF